MIQRLEKDLELWSINKVEYLKDTGRMDLERVRDMRNMQMIIPMKEIFIEGNLMGRVFTDGLMEKFMKVNGIKG